jgi:hypothetical protein
MGETNVQGGLQVMFQTHIRVVFGSNHGQDTRYPKIKLDSVALVRERTIPTE